MMDCITAVTPTACRLIGIQPPAVSEPQPLEAVLQAARATLGEAKIDRCLLYLPDCIGTQLVERYGQDFETVRAIAPTATPLRAVIPPKTPVCFASMFTGAQPAVHGIRKYEKPVLACDTIFDALLRAGRKPAIVSVTNCSMDRIFRSRAMDYFSEPDDEAVVARTFELLESGQHDFLICYQSGYDDCIHRVGPYGPEAIDQMRGRIANFRRVAGRMDACWAPYRRMIGFCPDHGNHTDPSTGRGDHSMDIPQDMEVHHFFGFRGCSGSRQ